jgi:hypothetical protein
VLSIFVLILQNFKLKVMKQTSLDTPPEVTPSDAPDKTPKTAENKTTFWLKRLGIGGFVFFLAKGILWLVLGKAALEALCN